MEFVSNIISSNRIQLNSVPHLALAKQTKVQVLGSLVKVDDDESKQGISTERDYRRTKVVLGKLRTS